MNHLSFKDWLSLQEMPINVNLVGDWQGARKNVTSGNVDTTQGVRFKDKENLAYRNFGQEPERLPVPGIHRWPSSSIKLLTNPKGQEKIVKRFKNVPEDFSVNMVLTTLMSGPDNHRYSDQGIVSPEFIRNKLGISEAEAPIYSDKINIFFLRNDGADVIDMNAWTIAHRFGHVAGYWTHGTTPGRTVGPMNQFEKEVNGALNRLLQECYNIKEPWRHTLGKLALCNALGTMKSARDNRISDIQDFVAELLSQYIFQRRLTFGQMPKQIPGEERNSLVAATKLYDLNGSYYQEEWQNMCQAILDQSIGQIFVM